MNSTPPFPSKKPEIDYFAGFALVFRDSNAGMNILLGSLFTLIPVVGPIVLLGWYCEVFQRLVRRSSAPLPKLDFNDFLHYLERGLTPFVVSLLISLPLAFLIMAVGGLGALMFSGMHRVWSEANLPFIIGGGLALLFSFMLLVMTVSNAGLTRAYLMENIGGALNVREIFSYAKATFKYVLLAYLIYFPISLLGLVFGMLALYVGIFVVSFILNLAWVYIAWQIYEVYIAEGGTPIPIRTPPAVLPSEQARFPLPPNPAP